MDPKRQSISEVGAYRIVAMVLRDLEAAARILGSREAVAPDPERAHHLEAIRSAIAELRTVVQPWPASDAYRGHGPLARVPPAGAGSWAGATQMADEPVLCRSRTPSACPA
jgi:hypothetical protein